MRLFFKGPTLKITNNQTNAYFILEIDLRKQSKLELEFENKKKQHDIHFFLSQRDAINIFFLVPAKNFMTVGTC